MTALDVSESLAWIKRHSPVEVALGAGASAAVGPFVRRRGAKHVLLVTDPHIRDAGHLRRVLASCEAAGLRVGVFDGVAENPTTAQVEAGVRFAKTAGAMGAPIDFLIGLGGGSAMDCAKGINFILSCGGAMADYRGDAPAEVLAKRPPLLPSVMIPTTAGTGSEAQSFALISDERTHMKMPCGDRRPPGQGGLRPLLAVLDPDLIATAPRGVTIAVGLDALTHALETSACKARDEVSREASRRAWGLLTASFSRVLAEGKGLASAARRGGQDTAHRAVAQVDSSALSDEDMRTGMLLGAHLAGVAIERSMLGAAHSCANPLTAKFDITHGIAVGLMMPHVIAFNAGAGSGLAANPYEELGLPGTLVDTMKSYLATAGILPRLRDHGVPREALAGLAEGAAVQWTARFNPREVGREELEAIFEAAW
ncbi:MAG: iron-containing alcohol dehydrogenase [Phycisphaerae bacterium]|nr:iron-containing alcohol dehydrogenase [Phycisphaerae bacterium]